jgi:ribose transport system ATP-binding protein
MPPLITAQDIEKRFGGVIALRSGQLHIGAGEVVALLGANGSGKSTLTKIITGVFPPDGGSLSVDGAPVHFRSPKDARKRGIAAVYQELSLIPDMTVTENIWLSHEPRIGVSIDRRAMRARTRDLLGLFAGATRTLDPDALVKDLPPDERQVVEILKAVSTDPRVLLLDEATASLGAAQVAKLFALIPQWKARGMGIVFVSHRMDEIFAIADRAVVLRSGQHVGDVSIREATHERLVGMMIEGAAAAHDMRVAQVPADAPVRLRVRGLRGGMLRGVDLDLRDGELLGIGGLQGQGQADLLLALFGAIPATGEIRLTGEACGLRHPSDAMARGVALVPGDRGREGLLLSRSILENMHLPNWAKFGGLLDMQRARKEGAAIAESLRIVMGGLDLPVSSLSGGNAQKVVIGKWLNRGPQLLLLNDPMKGVDVGAKSGFYALLAELSGRGLATLFYSSDDEELLGLCHRVLIFHDGRVAAELQGETLTRAHLVAASMGGALSAAHPHGGPT